MKILLRYPGHISALNKTGLSSKIYLGLKEVWSKTHASKLIDYAKREIFDVGTNMYFCVGFLRYGEKISIL